MLLGIITLFPEMFYAITNYGITGKAIRDGVLSIKVWNPREFTHNKYRSVDDRPYGGGPGMVMMIQPLRKAIDHARRELGNNSTVVYLSPQGKKINQKIICKLACNKRTVILVCGRYQGIDERLITLAIDEEWSIGDYILSGGELAAMVCIDAVVRILPNVLNNHDSRRADSFFKNRLDHPQYTRPKKFEGMAVPAVLLSGNHRSIYRWRLKQSLGQTWVKRPDLLMQSLLTEEEQSLLMEFKNEYLLNLNQDIIK